MQSAAFIAAQVVGFVPEVGVKTDAAQLEVLKDPLPGEMKVLLTMVAIGVAALLDA